MENNLYSWYFDDKKERSGTWYIIFLSIMIWLVLWGFFTKQYGMSFVIILLSGLMYFMDNNSEDTINVEIHELWLKVSNNFYDFSRIENYWIIYTWEHAQYLRLKLTKSAINQIDLWINNQIASDLRQILPNYIQETDNVEMTMLEKTIKILKL